MTMYYDKIWYLESKWRSCWCNKICKKSINR
jgi:hypothetical protein